MHLCNNTKTRPVSITSKPQEVRQFVDLPDGNVGIEVVKDKPISSDASSFTLQNQLKTGVKFDAPQGAFFKPTALEQSDMIQETASVLNSAPESAPEPAPEPAPESAPDPAPEPAL